MNLFSAHELFLIKENFDVKVNELLLMLNEYRTKRPDIDLKGLEELLIDYKSIADKARIEVTK